MMQSEPPYPDEVKTSTEELPERPEPLPVKVVKPVLVIVECPRCGKLTAFRDPLSPSQDHQGKTVDAWLITFPCPEHIKIELIAARALRLDEPEWP